MISPQTHLLLAWLSVTVFSILGAAAFLVWAVRSRQFSKQDRARYLALDDVPPEETSDRDQNNGSHRHVSS